MFDVDVLKIDIKVNNQLTKKKIMNDLLLFHILYSYFTLDKCYNVGENLFKAEKFKNVVM